MGTPDNNSLDKNNENNNNPALPRENLIKHAVSFLSDKKIRNQDPSLLKQFLVKKGLTEEEAAIAFQRCELQTSQSLVKEYGAPLSGPVQHYAVPQSPVQHSIWNTIHIVVTTITSLVGTVYVIYWLWKNYISPYLFGRKPKKKPAEVTLAELEAAVNGCVTDVRTVRNSLEALALDRTSELTQGVVVNKIQEVKSEINSLKALLLNRNQFPATPAPLGTTPLTIPAWQLSAESSPPEQEVEGEAEHEEESSGSNGGTNGSDSSLEIVKDPNH